MRVGRCACAELGRGGSEGGGVLATRCVSVGVGENEGVVILNIPGDILAPEEDCKREDNCEYCCLAVAHVTVNRRLSTLTVSEALACLCICRSSLDSLRISLQRLLICCI